MTWNTFATQTSPIALSKLDENFSGCIRTNPDGDQTIASGNIGLGVTPSGWGANYKVIDEIGRAHV